MKLIIGLGNPGEKYESTRHNLGFFVVDHLLKDIGTSKIVWNHTSKFKSDIATFLLTAKDGQKEKVLIAKPQTYMNNSGVAVQLLMGFYKIEPYDLWVVYDELDLPLGSIKIRFGGAAAGHHGVESIMSTIGTDAFWRFRLGIGVIHDKFHLVGKHDFRDAKDYVLDNFHLSEAGKARELIKKSTEAIQTALEKGLDTAMNRFNTK
ncbi:MAG TPA: aminoacyl-tRNA hydrolase [Candidatus Sulfotelmatobacter sp.]|jgi:PTH1 family peptidyl-tRNA hydrolase|nr:aminoacyl-tRNA hydrolase [Candidatus Sulfotelmatobacter sp.]